ncbi:hypothetical protein THMIRHAS_09160 [Thiosulfatimonas sediminis]|uniref:Flagellar hook-length control protein-like C-terminal domain-containing protein n=1 Tax=Thiosulfatimonas sediminis TaxID=2675054 RepID=A0A6F8PTS7_9GAMM|nr:flagellar hook-length control protein FliK [Thiosulfatimonas sediminis]BBP45543.1 hypothetical protein THMIRHAS_09160 [Thiosulfatimonas sediminis]
MLALEQTQDKSAIIAAFKVAKPQGQELPPSQNKPPFVQFMDHLQAKSVVKSMADSVQPVAAAITPQSEVVSRALPVGALLVANSEELPASEIQNNALSLAPAQVLASEKPLNQLTSLPSGLLRSLDNELRGTDAAHDELHVSQEGSALNAIANRLQAAYPQFAEMPREEVVGQLRAHLLRLSEGDVASSGSAFVAEPLSSSQLKDAVNALAEEVGVTQVVDVAFVEPRKMADAIDAIADNRSVSVSLTPALAAEKNLKSQPAILSNSAHLKASSALKQEGFSQAVASAAIQHKEEQTFAPSQGFRDGASIESLHESVDGRQLIRAPLNEEQITDSESVLATEASSESLLESDSAPLAETQNTLLYPLPDELAEEQSAAVSASLIPGEEVAVTSVSQGLDADVNIIESDAAALPEEQSEAVSASLIPGEEVAVTSVSQGLDADVNIIESDAAALPEEQSEAISASLIPGEEVAVTSVSQGLDADVNIIESDAAALPEEQSEAISASLTPSEEVSVTAATVAANTAQVPNSNNSAAHSGAASANNASASQANAGAAGQSSSQNSGQNLGQSSGQSANQGSSQNPSSSGQNLGQTAAQMAQVLNAGVTEQRRDLVMGARQQAQVRAADEALQKSSALSSSATDSLTAERRALLPPSMQSIPLPVRHPQWGQAFGQRVTYMLNAQVQQAQITLNPEKLGPIQIKLHFDRDQQMQLSVVAQHGATRDAIDASLPRLREMLEQQGINLASVDVETGANFAEQQAQAQENQTTSGLGAQGAGSVGVDEESNVTTVVSDALVDYYA